MTSVRARLVAMAVSAVLLTVAAVGYVMLRRSAALPPEASAAAPLATPTLDGRELLMVRAGPGADSGVVLAVSGGTARSTGVRCRRFYAAGGTGVCLRVKHGLTVASDAIVLDERLREVRRVALPGVPSRARVSASGRMVSWTLFTTGDSYLTTGFSTRTGVLDTRTGKVAATLEDFTMLKDGRPEKAADLNYWGVTFAADDNVFYATAATGGQTYLVQGDFAARRMRMLRENAECPSLSPDGSRLVYKKRTGDAAIPWRLNVLDLRSGRETPLAEQASVDDQAAWLDDRTVMYARPRDDSLDVWRIPADGSGPPQVLARDAFSPAPPYAGL